jgi:hypothetical protein
MPGRESHLSQAGRFEGFLAQINTPSQHYREWVVIVWFHIALHYVDAVLADKGHVQIEGHSDRFAKMASHGETRAVLTAFERLYKDSKEARYQGGEYTPLDLDGIKRRYEQIRNAMRQALRLPDQL